MRSKERVLKSLQHQKPDRPPIFATFTPQIGDALNRQLGIEDDGLVDSFFANRISYTRAGLRLGNDCVCVAACTPLHLKPQANSDGTVTDEWGITSKQVGLYSEMIDYPLKGAEAVADIDSFPFPDPDIPERYDFARAVIDRYGSEYAVIGEQECTVFELSWYLVGLEKFLIDLAMGKAYVFALLDRVMEISLKQASHLIDLGADIIWFGDDFGDQKGMLISPDMWRRIFKPRYRYVFQKAKKLNPELKIAYHSCGSIRPIIPDLMEIGLDILNPIQPRAAGMDPGELKSDYGKSLTFMGGIDIQQLLPQGSPETIKREVRKIISVLGKNGGYIAAPAHNIQPDTPLENIYAFFEAVKGA